MMLCISVTRSVQVNVNCAPPWPAACKAASECELCIHVNSNSHTMVYTNAFAVDLKAHAKH
jgi:hypothetical protein